MNKKHWVCTFNCCLWKRLCFDSNGHIYSYDTCGECDFTTKERLVEILVFQVFDDYYRFPKVDENSRLKVLENKILVSVCTTLE